MEMCYLSQFWFIYLIYLCTDLTARTKIRGKYDVKFVQNTTVLLLLEELSFPSNCHTEVKLGVPYLFSGGASVFPVDLLGETVSYPNIFYLLGIVHKAVGRNL